ncbi:LemA family protein, partial [Patescibacteria group bacterium]
MDLENILVIVIATVFLLSLWIIVGYRNMKGLKKGINKQWKQVTNHLNLRQNLVPNLVETVKKHTNKQDELIEKIIKQRVRAITDNSP